MTKLKCPDCGSTQIVLSGKVQCGKKKKQRYQCNNCGLNTCYPIGIEKPPKKVRKVILRKR